MQDCHTRCITLLTFLPVSDILLSVSLLLPPTRLSVTAAADCAILAAADCAVISYEFCDYGSLAFAQIRDSFGIAPEEYCASLGPESLMGNLLLGNLCTLSGQ